MKTLLALSLSAPLHAATIDDLWITEVLPSTGQVEVTNVGVGAVTTGSALPFCHRFSYSPSIPAGTSFEEGESKVFILSFSNPLDSDLWLYRNRSFGNGENIIAGLKWGEAQGVGRTVIATEEGHWDGSNVAPAATGESLQLVGRDPASAESWKSGPPGLGSFAFPLGAVTPRIGEGQIELDWEGGMPPFRVMASDGLQAWEPITGLLSARNHVVPTEGRSRRFFQIVDGASLEASASFRITFTSLWSRSTFASVPGGDHFSGLVGGMHDASVSFWGPGDLASPGIERMAETGSKTSLLAEVNSAITAGTAQQTLSGGGLGAAGSTTVLNFTAERSHPLVTITSMIAPSPDWFVGLHDQSLLQGNEDWVDRLSFDLLAYDAGTDSGSSFTSGNAATNPAEPVFLIPATDPNFAPASGPTGAHLPIARIVIERVDP